MAELPTGTVMLLVADVEGSTRLWETQPDELACAVERLDQTLSKAIATRRWADHGSPFPTVIRRIRSRCIPFERC